MSIKWQRHWLLVAFPVLLVFAAAVFFLTNTPGARVSYQERTIGAWFNDFLKSDWKNPISDIRTNPPVLAFLEMEGDAVRFLAYRCAWGWSRFDGAYAELHKKLPLKIRAALPSPRPDPRGAALWLLGGIGRTQNAKTWEGKPSTKLPVQQAMPAIRKALKDPVLCSSACHAIEGCGPAAREAVPDLVGLLAADYALTRVNHAAMRALGAIGAAASNAVPLLSAMAADKALGRERLTAARVLGDIGAPARCAAPIVGSLLIEYGTSHGVFLLDALARLGETPEETVPVLRHEMEHGSALAQVYATVALWNREPANPDLQAKINARLLAAIEMPRRAQEPVADARFLAGPLLATLCRCGTNAAVFAPAIRRIVQSRDPVLSDLAAYTLQESEDLRRAGYTVTGGH